MPSAKYSRFSLGRVWTLATHTMTQLVRMKILLFLLVFAVITIGAGFAFPAMSPEQQLKLLKDVSFGVLLVFSVVISIAATALLIPRDLEDRTLYTILSKPIPRYEYLMGKLLGVILLLFCSLLLMDVVLSGVVYLKQQSILQTQIAALEMDHNATPENIAALTAYINNYGLNWSMHAGVWAIFLKASVITSLTLLISCLASSTLFTIITSLLFVIAGHGQELMRSFFLPHFSGFAKQALGSVLALLCPDLGLFDFVDQLLRGEVIPFSTLSYVSGIAVLYVAGYTLVAYLFFVEKEL